MRIGAAAVLAALVLAVGTSPAAATVTIGQTQATADTCDNGFDWIQPTVTEGNGYLVPEQGTVTSWSTTARSPGGTMTMKILRNVAGPTYRVVGHEGPHDLTDGVLNTFSGFSIPVQAGDVLGLYVVSGSPACVFDVIGDAAQFDPLQANLADGQAGDFQPSSGFRLNVTAQVTPSNSFTVGSITRNKKRGTATIGLTLPNPGELTATGAGAKTAGGARISKAVAAGQAQLVIKASGKKKRKLNRTGKVKLSLSVTYTPANGGASTQPVKVKLRKKL
jgi:hypothetical protein